MFWSNVVALWALASSAALPANQSADAQSARLEANSADNFLKGIDDGDALPALLLLSYTEAYSAANAKLIIAGKPMLYCIPMKLTLGQEQAIIILREYVKDRPEEGKYPASLLMLTAMQHTFPCPPRDR